ncbi:MAG: hypothetical protein JL50_13745 [Peptococcaceae bacterium BICA1-7]|nr:MAG: hypothetical protein JL50_13745 [Peptococcaceae bacterium BICA1-7]HBV99479.1 two-component sensor histidine kinase [Desulfotomaculum sp.]
MDNPAGRIIKILNSIELPFAVITYPDFDVIMSNAASNGNTVFPWPGGEPELSAFEDILHRSAKSRRVARYYMDGRGEAGRYEVIIAPAVTEKGNTSHIIVLMLEAAESSLFSKSNSGAVSFLPARQEQAVENERLALIGQLTLGIAHEIKNPLTVISGFAEVTKSKLSRVSGHDELKESIAYYQQEIVDNCRNMNRLLVDLLQVARPRKTEKIPVNMAGILERICNIIAPFALQRNVTLIKDLIDADVEIYTDTIKLRQVLLNLCNNAVQSMTGGGILRIRAEKSCEHLIISVTDTGCGISPDDINKLGTPFYTTKAEGTGLGLTVTYSIVRDLGGRIEVDSQLGRGTTFRVYLLLNAGQDD